MDKKNKKLYYTIGEVAEMFDVNTSLLRFWEKEFPSYIKPKRSRSGNRLYTQKDIDNIGLIYYYVKELGMTLDGAKKMLKVQKGLSPDKKAEIISSLENVKEALKEIYNTL